ncbi:MAG: hypothetical protein JSW55_01010 [Chloroflexota bacterium]|nr:MAG: hypothetical protein JSW55_01010 [Chloroflexota bacterium]
MKWMPRIISLLVLVFYLSLWLFNEDVRSRPTPAVMFQGLLTVALLVAWRWEKRAGLLAMVGGITFFLVVAVGAVALYDIQSMAALLGGVLLALPYVLAGGLFFVAGRELESARGGEANRQPIAPQ